MEFALAWSALGFGLFYLALASLLWNRHRDSLRLLCEAFAALGVIFASLTIPLAFDEQATSVMWAVEGAGLLWLYLRRMHCGDKVMLKRRAAFLARHASHCSVRIYCLP